MNRTLKIAAIAATLLVITGIAALAAAPGRLVPIHQDIKDWFAARGANPVYLDKVKSEVPADEWAKILAILNTPDDTDVTTDDHDVLNTLVMESLMLATTTTDDPVYLDIGNHRWIHEQDTDDD